METTIALTMKEQKRVEIIQRVFRRELRMAEAALVLGVTERHAYRVKARIRKEGVRGVVHGNRGRLCSWKLSQKNETKIVELARGKYRGFNDHHLTEKLVEEQEIEISREKVRRILRSHGIASPRKRRPARHRSRRQRREAEGMMLQLDGSPHDWLQGRGPSLCLIGAIDDAISKVPAAFFEQAETSWAYLHLFSEIFSQEGFCYSAYADRHSIFWTDREPTVEEQLLGKRPKTQVGRALEELDITLIPAGSPQAKGRIERLWGTFQDRLVSELRLVGAKSKAEAQAVLDHFLPQYNRRFSKPALVAKPAWRKVEHKQLEQSLCFKYQRVVAKDNTVGFCGLVLALPKISPFISWAHKMVDIHVLLDGSVQIFHPGQSIARFNAKTLSTMGLRRNNGRWTAKSLGPQTNSPQIECAPP